MMVNRSQVMKKSRHAAFGVWVSWPGFHGRERSVCQSGGSQAAVVAKQRRDFLADVSFHEKYTSSEVSDIMHFPKYRGKQVHLGSSPLLT